MKRPFSQFIGNCVSFNYRPQEDIDHLSEMIDIATPITYTTFMKHVPVAVVAGIFSMYAWGRGRKRDLRMKKDWAIGFYRSTFAGRPCYYIRWSAIEYIFMEPTS